MKGGKGDLKIFYINVIYCKIWSIYTIIHDTWYKKRRWPGLVWDGFLLQNPLGRLGERIGKEELMLFYHTADIKLEKKRKPSFFKGIATRAPAASCKDVRKMHSGKAWNIINKIIKWHQKISGFVQFNMQNKRKCKTSLPRPHQEQQQEESSWPNSERQTSSRSNRWKRSQALSLSSEQEEKCTAHLFSKCIYLLCASAYGQYLWVAFTFLLESCFTWFVNNLGHGSKSETTKSVFNRE